MPSASSVSAREAFMKSSLISSERETGKKVSVLAGATSEALDNADHPHAPFSTEDEAVVDLANCGALAPRLPNDLVL
eukprot:4159520-Heterocapsa_arctica.AAC.1